MHRVPATGGSFKPAMAGIVEVFIVVVLSNGCFWLTKWLVIVLVEYTTSWLMKCKVLQLCLCFFFCRMYENTHVNRLLFYKRVCIVGSYFSDNSDKTCKHSRVYAVLVSWYFDVCFQKDTRNDVITQKLYCTHCSNNYYRWLRWDSVTSQSHLCILIVGRLMSTLELLCYNISHHFGCFLSIFDPFTYIILLMFACKVSISTNIAFPT